MLAEDRRSYILRQLEARSSVTVSQLSAAFRISEVSVRKLLASMQKEGSIRRTWGGAVSACGSLREFSHKEKEPVCLQEKAEIARAAYACISDGDAVFLDCGTTTVHLARLIRTGTKRNLMVATTGVNIAMELAEAEDIPVILLDHTKFGDDSLSLIALVSELDGVITDRQAPPEILGGLQEQGVRVIRGGEPAV